MQLVSSREGIGWELFQRSCQSHLLQSRTILEGIGTYRIDTGWDGDGLKRAITRKSIACYLSHRESHQLAANIVVYASHDGDGGDR